MKASRRDFSHLATACSSTLRVSRAPEPYGTSAGHRHQVVEHAGQLAERLGAVTASARSSYSVAVEPALGVGLGERPQHDVAVGVGGPHRRVLRRPRVVGELAPQLGTCHSLIVGRATPGTWTSRRCRPTAWPSRAPGPTTRGSHDHPVIKVGPGERGKIFAFLGDDGVGVKSGAVPRGGRRVAAAVPG